MDTIRKVKHHRCFAFMRMMTLMALSLGVDAISADAANVRTYHTRSYSSGFAAQTQAALYDMLQRGYEAERRGPPSLAQELHSFYAMRDFHAVWSGYAGAEEMAAEVRLTLSQADRQGLSSADYSVDAASTEPRRGSEAAEYDLSLTHALVRYAFDVRTGRIPARQIYRDVQLPQNTFDPVRGLAEALKTGSLSAFLAALPPPHPEYRRLVVALERYRDIGDNVRLPAVSTENGREPRGTRAEMNVAASYRMQQIIANMERWRWLPPVFERRYIAVNVPSQSVAYIQDGQVQLSSRAIVGRKTTPTPILRTAIDAVIVNPPWDIPGDIAARTLLPRLRKDPNYLASRNMIVVDGPAGDPRANRINWNAVSATNFPYRIRQMPPNSALGVLMLNSPNDFDVYLHDTPGRKDFALSDRGISNGCIRVQEIFSFASLALTGDPAASAEMLRAQIASRETRRLALHDALPLYMLYWTAIADDTGHVVFYPDRYQRDAQLIAALARARTFS